MTKKNENESVDDLAPELRKALVECGAIIPTTSEDVALVEKNIKSKLTSAQIDAAFGKLEEVLGKPEDLSFVKLNSSILQPQSDEMSMAARNGCEIDEETRAKIDETVERILKKPPQDSSK